MKKYFAKWLPVEGEIKEGDMLISENGIFKCTAKREAQPSDRIKKAKLFLCTKDCSRIGAKVFAYQYNHVSTIKELIGGSVRDVILEEMPESIKNNTLDRGQLYEIIGEISPDAYSYVKEGGQEFDENEVEQFLGWEEGDTIFYKIKGPCGHFH